MLIGAVARKSLFVFQVIRTRGPLPILREMCEAPFSQTSRSKWILGKSAEVLFWDAYIRTRGLQWTDDYKDRLNPNLPLQKYIRELLPRRTEVQILDVGAGPLTYLGKKSDRKCIHITAVDALTDEFDRILDKYHVEPLVRTRKLDAECLACRFSEDTFDLVFARNAIDHSYDPERAILQMVEVVKPGCYVLLEGRPNEAERQHYHGLHQWNFDVNRDGEFLIRSRDTQINITRKYSKLCSITCRIKNKEPDVWLRTKIRKLKS